MRLLQVSFRCSPFPPVGLLSFSKHLRADFLETWVLPRIRILKLVKTILLLSLNSLLTYDDPAAAPAFNLFGGAKDTSGEKKDAPAGQKFCVAL
jgi:hypothetical protein